MRVIVSIGLALGLAVIPASAQEPSKALSAKINLMKVSYACGASPTYRAAKESAERQAMRDDFGLETVIDTHRKMESGDIMKIDKAKCARLIERAMDDVKLAGQ